MGDPDRLTSTVAPARAARDEGATGTQRSSHTSTWKVRSGRSTAWKSRSGPKGTAVAAESVALVDAAPSGEMAVAELPVEGASAEALAGRASSGVLTDGAFAEVVSGVG